MNRFWLKCDLFFFSRMNWIFYAKMPRCFRMRTNKQRFSLFKSSFIRQSLASKMTNQTSNFRRHLRGHSGSRIGKWVIVESIHLYLYIYGIVSIRSVSTLIAPQFSVWMNDIEFTSALVYTYRCIQYTHNTYIHKHICNMPEIQFSTWMALWWSHFWFETKKYVHSLRWNHHTLHSHNIKFRY